MIQISSNNERVTHLTMISNPEHKFILLFLRRHLLSKNKEYPPMLKVPLKNFHLHISKCVSVILEVLPQQLCTE